MMFQLRRLFIALIVGLVITVVSMAVLAVIPVAMWDVMQPSTCLAAGNCFCETVHAQDSVRQPANTVSSFGFVFVGIWMIAVSPVLLERRSRLLPMYGAALGTMAGIVGVGSAFYHASLTFIGQFFDILGMYLLASFVLVYALGRLNGWSDRRSMAVYLVLNVVLTVIQIIIPDLRRYTFGIVLVVGLVIEWLYWLRRRPTMTRRWLQTGLGIFALAYGIWILDNSRVVCAPQSLLQGHALWHLLGAVAVGCLFLYYASERSAP